MTSIVDDFKGRAVTHCGDNREILPQLGLCWADSIVTDPPYEIGFMGNSWDKSGIAYDVAMWRLCLDALKPGGYLLAFGSPRTYHRLACAIEDAGFEVVNSIYWLYGSGFPKNANTQLKPAHEPIVMAQKPFSGSARANVEKWGTGYLNIDECRIPAPEGLTPGGCMRTKSPMYMSAQAGVHHKDCNRDGHQAGRWPANVIHDASEEVLAEFTKYGETVKSDRRKRKIANQPPGKNGIYGTFSGAIQDTPCYSDIGTVARFFYAAKASTADRGKYNDHPTVKPTSLMRYLCRLVTPKGGIVADNFMGSGSTGKAAVLEGLNFVGIDNRQSAIDIATRRIEEARKEVFGKIQF